MKPPESGLDSPSRADTSVNWKRRTLSLRGAAAFLILTLASGCSIYLEHKRPDYTDVTKIEKGTPRYDVMADLGRPIESYKDDGKDVDVFQVDPNGRYAGTKTAVITFDTVADIFTIGMWEAVATPAEMLTKHKLKTFVVTYNPEETVESIKAVPIAPKPKEAKSAAVESSEAPTTSSAASPAPSESPTPAVSFAAIESPPPAISLAPPMSPAAAETQPAATTSPAAATGQ